MKTVFADVAVIGAGPAGLAAAAQAKKSGAKRVVVLERNPAPGGILRQCIHDGFGLYRYGKALTGPEYAALAANEAASAGAELMFGCTVTELNAERQLYAVSRSEYFHIRAKAVVWASGCRERTRGALMIPGSRPAGVFTAGTVQEMLNLMNLKIGRRAVILGSGDVGLIAARRLTLCGTTVAAIAEAGPEPSGLARNVAQCAADFGIPLLTRTTVGRIIGAKRVEGVELCSADEAMRPIPGTERTVPCDTLVLSVGLIPETELLRGAGLFTGAQTDRYLSTAVPGIFSCGNCRKVEQLADFVSECGEAAGRNAARFALGLPPDAVIPEKSRSLPTGFPAPGAVTCTLCPRGCTVQCSGDGVFSGNFCPRGAEFARAEQTSPMRTFTASLPSASGRAVSVRSASPVPVKDLLPLARRLSGKVLPGKSYSAGDELPDLGVRLIVTGQSSF